MININEREEFAKLLKIACAGTDVHFNEEREEAFWRACCGRMTLAQFSRAVDVVLKSQEKRRGLTTQQILNAAHEIRAKQYELLPIKPRDEVPDDRWLTRANFHLLRYISRRAAREIHYCDADTVAGKHPANNPSALAHKLTEPLVKYKNAWAQDMRDEAALHPRGEVDSRYQRDNWFKCMELAEAEISQVRASHTGN